MMSQIVVNPEILGGKPIVDGMRLSVDHVCGMLSSGMSNAEIIADYPVLNEENLQAVRAFVSRRAEASRRTNAWQIRRNGVRINLPAIRD